MSNDVTDVWASLRSQIDAHRPDRPSGRRDVTSGTVPVTLLTGFLGAGKSTILVHLLQNPGGLKVKALVNDVGRLPFDPTLVDDSDSLRVELANGCGCCTATGDLADALDSLMNEGHCDLIVVEASGAADPRVLEHVIHANDGLDLDRTVAVVDGVLLATGRIADWTGTNIVRQIGRSDCVIVSGCDRLSAPDVERVIEDLSQLAPGRTIECSGLASPASHVLVPGSVRGVHLGETRYGASHEDMHVVTVEQVRDVPGPVFVAEIERARPGLIRAKGRLFVEGRYVHVQVTPSTVEITESDAGPTAITFISRDPSSIDLLVGLIA